MRCFILLAFVLAQLSTAAQTYQLTVKKTDQVEYAEDFSGIPLRVWLNSKYDTAMKSGYYYENGKYIIEGEKGIGIFRNFANASANGLKKIFSPFEYGNKYVEAEFNHTRGADTSIRYGLLMGQTNGTGYIMLIKPDGRFQVSEQYYPGKGNETAERILKDYAFSDAIKKGLNQVNKVRYEIETQNNSDSKFLYSFYINGKLVYTHTGPALYGEDLRISKRGVNYRLEVDNISFGTFRSELTAPVWSFNGLNELAKRMMDESLNLNNRRSDFIRACEPFREKYSDISGEMRVAGKTYKLRIPMPEKENARISYHVENVAPAEMDAFVNAYMSGLRNHLGIKEFAPSYNNYNVYGFPFFTHGEFEVKRGAVLLRKESEIYTKREFLNILIDYNKKPFVPIKVARLNEHFQNRIREILSLCDKIENYKGALFQQSDKGILGASLFYRYTGPKIEEIAYEPFVRKIESLSYADRYDLGWYIVDGNASKAKEEYAKWINYITYALGPDYLIVPLTSGSTGKQLVTSSSVQSIAFRSKDMADGRFIKLQLDNQRLLLYFGLTGVGSDYDNDYYEETY